MQTRASASSRFCCMQIVIMTIIISLLIAFGALIAFLWAVKSGQYDDAYTPAVRILHDDRPVGVDSDQKDKKQTNKDKINADRDIPIR